MVNQPFKNIAPPLGSSIALGAMCAAFLPVLVLPDEIGPLRIIAALAVGLSGTLAWSAVFFRRYWVYGVAMEGVGFLFRAPLRKLRLIRWNSITLVTASALHDELGESAITFHVKSDSGRAWISPTAEAYLPFLKELSTLKGFDERAWLSAHVGKDELLRSIVPKRTAIFQRPKNVAAA
jgi:hypothetical protein